MFSLTEFVSRPRSRFPCGRKATWLFILAVLSVMALFASLHSGAASASVAEAIRALVRGDDAGNAAGARDALIVMNIRLPRAVLGYLTGAALAVSGSLMQGLFRNPLADPGVIGVTSGASLGAVSFIVLAGWFGLDSGIFTNIGLPAAAFLGGLAVTALLYRIASRHGTMNIAILLVAGIALGALAMAVTGMLVYSADEQQLRDITFWNLGSLAGATWYKVIICTAVLLPCLAASVPLSNGLNAMALGEAVAHHMGVDVIRLKKTIIVLVALMAGSSVAFTGMIGFVGIVVPHILRLAVGPDHRFLLPASALLGGGLLVLADIFARTVVAPSELPIGIVTALIGAPFFLRILLRDRKDQGISVV